MGVRDEVTNHFAGNPSCYLIEFGLVSWPITPIQLPPKGKSYAHQSLFTLQKQNSSPFGGSWMGV